MQQLDHPSTTQALIAQILERLTNVVDDLKEVKSQNAETNRQLAQVVGLQRDIAHLGARVEKVENYVGSRAERDAIQDGDIKSLKSRQRAAWGALAVVATIAASAVGWTINKAEQFGQIQQRIEGINTRVSTLELTANKGNIERSMSPTKEPNEAHR